MIEYYEDGVKYSVEAKKDSEQTEEMISKM